MINKKNNNKNDDCVFEVGLNEKELDDFIKRLMELAKNNHTHLEIDKNKKIIIYLK